MIPYSRRVIREQGQNKTVLFSSHILQEVEAICDRVIIINKGTLVADDKLANLQQKERNDLIKVSFKEPLEPEWLKRLNGVKAVNKLDSFTWQIQATDTNDVKRQLLELSLQHSLNIVSLQTEGGSLEEIFRSLTTSNKEEKSTSVRRNDVQ